MDFISKNRSMRPGGDGKGTEAVAARDHLTLMNRLKMCSQNDAAVGGASRSILLSKLEKYGK